MLQNLFRRNAEQPHLVGNVGQVGAEELAAAFGNNNVAGFGRHKETNASLVADNAIAHHFGVGAHNGVLVHADFGRQLAYRVEFVARHQLALQNAVGYAVGNLLKYTFLFFEVHIVIYACRRR